ncbi:phosphoribosylglycinamide formyltransferase [Phenylobacterium sp. NIBR 498073]|uniref:phosphoribosylglycinamide formyltransferase n=1 Tax=Phenylobacterium sp. NIBR 498073 TaxID=3015177 RepID=UPI0022B4D836|nr:phosphoribosylglycinamide formyltransferase [Phenylobacterium sp. NIBR 498073]WGU38394.1 phosphoribosylglycinamide formyltransferase [Phenylobacterium sp. NIBR 498073]
MISSPLKLGFLASKNGTSMRAIVEAARAGGLAVEPRLVVSNNRKAPALEFAAERGVPTLVIPTQADPEAADAALCAALEGAGVELVILSGYLRRLGPLTLGRYRNRILNIHPGLLPAFGGEGMYGRRVHEAVIAAGASESGATIHAVDEIYDHGPVIERRTVPVLAGDTAETLEARVAAMEPGFFVETLARIAAGELRLPD